ncbi:hypothetical protein M427DRAFT_66823 [Gonapodya prolifera JEL478]|uniref:Adenylate kinase n=1 Tax=Gonapodya prolifera (strain JEL478) TaxID=1344416 RepID=A0A139AV10_GONPJ|nr:hypothetical protein M427DRAFT_66823 [Gonapodya prolifera JEL478]|eukprot:KXS20325.1 hypothetical protein M427DRAFT_66823 [Gonapodya prolifera JEL478]
MDPNDLLKAAATDKIAAYADEKDLRAFLESLLDTLLRARPQDPVSFLIDSLRNPQGPRILLFAPPFCSRQEIARLLSERLHLPHLSSGALLRHHVSHRTPLGIKARPFVERGELAPDDCAAGVVLEKVAEGKDGALIEGYPRTREQSPPPHLHAKLASYRRNLALLLPLLPKPCVTIEVQHPWGAEEAVSAKVELALKEGKVVQGPRGVRVAVVAEEGLGVDRERVASGLAGGRWGGVYVSTRTVLREFATTGAANAEEYFLDSSTAPPELIADLVARRLNRPDARAQGYILDGIPTTKLMAEKMSKAGVKIDRLLYLHPGSQIARPHSSGSSRPSSAGSDSPSTSTAMPPSASPVHQPSTNLADLLAHFGATRVRKVPVRAGDAVRSIVERCEAAVGKVGMGIGVVKEVKDTRIDSGRLPPRIGVAGAGVPK